METAEAQTSTQDFSLEGEGLHNFLLSQKQLLFTLTSKQSPLMLQYIKNKFNFDITSLEPSNYGH